jgi:replication factor C subunit 2/4
MSKTTVKNNKKTPIKIKQDVKSSGVPWIEKYRPQKLEDLVLDKRIEQQLSVYLKDNQMPHLIVTGTSGIGKTSTMKCLARKLLGNNFEQGFLELNSSDDRGIKTLLSILQPFCMKKVLFNQFKIILLDEADGITSKAQGEIGRLMKIHNNTTKFIFTCNDSTEIIESIQSNCAIIRFLRLTSEQIIRNLKNICSIENIKYDEEGLSTIAYTSQGDMRKAINNLQVTYYSFEKVNRENVFKICEYPDPELLKEIVNLTLDKKIIESNEKLMNLKVQGFLTSDIIVSLLSVLQDYPMNESLKLKYINIVNQTSIEISKGIDSDLQLQAMLARLLKLHYLS